MPMPFVMDWLEYDKAGDNFFINTPTTMAIYTMHNILDHMIKNGGIEAYNQLSLDRANSFYGNIDESMQKYKAGDAVMGYKNPIVKDLRSTMNPTFWVDCVKPELNAAIEADFVKESTRAGFLGI